jgi:serine/threonine protein kinase
MIGHVPTATPSRTDTSVYADTLADATSATIGAPVTKPGAGSVAPSKPGRTSTVLPRVEASSGNVRLVREARARYETERVLGEGGMGVVDLARDQDIDRPVAIKRIRGELAGDIGLARFAEEVRTIGSLEHPNIVPVHDVGLDEQGRYFLVMKYVEGETVERIIERLASGDADAHRLYPFDARVQIFLGLLRALAYAHDRGIIHRDIKPANVMVGPYGEVVLMDWGVARPIKGTELPAEPEAEEPDDGSSRKRLVATATSALVGTPMYMSPEQALGASDLDERSDLYSACVLFHELMSLKHYLHDKSTLTGVLTGVHEVQIPSPLDVGSWTHPHQNLPPAEWLHFLRRGLEKERGERWQSAHEMIERIETTLGGEIRVQCPVTASKRATREAGRFIDRWPRLSVAIISVAITATIAGIAGGVLSLVM